MRRYIYIYIYIYGLDNFIERYGHQSGFPDMGQHMAEFDDWQLTAPCKPRPLTILRCPEDRKCHSKCSKRRLGSKTMRSECVSPVCNHCNDSLTNKEVPQMHVAALANDLMTCYAPSILYDEKVAVMELICASVCLTTMISFTSEKV